MASTDLTTIEKGSFLALDRSITEIREIIDDTLAGQQLGEFDLPRVGIPPGGGGHWTIPTALGDDSSPELTGIVVAFQRTRAYWPSPDPTGEPPVCRSHDALVGIGDPGGDCRTCPLAQYGSSPKGDNAQACKEREVWFMLREGSFLPLVLTLPATSLKGAKRYRVNLASGAIRLSDVVTAITLRKERGPSGDYGIAEPRVAAKLSEEAASAARAYAAELRPMFAAAAASVAESAPNGAPKVDADGDGIEEA